MKKLLIISIAISLVFAMAGIARADWMGTYYITDPDPIAQVDPWTFDVYGSMSNQAWGVELLWLFWTDDVDDPYQNFAINTFDSSFDTFTWNIVDPVTELDATLYLSGLLDLKELTPGLVGGTLTSNPGNNTDLYFSGIELVFDSPSSGQDTPHANPEPATMLLLGTGLIGMAGIGRKKLFRT